MTRKLSDAQVTSIRDRWAQGETVTALAAEYGVRQSTVSMIVTGARHAGHGAAPQRTPEAEALARDRALTASGRGLSQSQSRTAGARIRGLRKALGWKQGELAAKAGIRQTMVSRSESGTVRMSPRTAAAIAAALGVSLEDLLAECGHCHGNPPAGFACLSCGTERPS